MLQWLLEQWNDIKGNAKWAVVMLILSAMVVAAIALTHGLAIWQQVALATLFILMLAWGIFMTAATSALTRRTLKQAPAIEPSGQANLHAFSNLDHARLADTKHQLLCLSHFERFALWQLLLKGGLTGDQFADLVEAYGIPVATRFGQEELAKTYTIIQGKAALLVHDQTSGRWTITPESKDFVQFLIERMSPIFGI